MKNVMMTLLFTLGIAATQLSAQSACTPNPTCCKTTCSKGKTAANGEPAKAETLAACTPEQLKACSATSAATQSNKTAKTHVAATQLIEKGVVVKTDAVAENK